MCDQDSKTWHTGNMDGDKLYFIEVCGRWANAWYDRAERKWKASVDCHRGCIDCSVQVDDCKSLVDAKETALTMLFQQVVNDYDAALSCG